MTDTFSLLASIHRKVAIRDTKAEFLAKRYAARLQPLAQAAGVVIDPNPDTDEIKAQNEALLMAKYKEFIQTVAAADPTDAQDKNDFTEWLLKMWLNMDDAHRGRWVEDTPNIKRNLTEFSDIRKTPEFKSSGASSDLNNYKDLPALFEVVKKFSSASARFALPTLSEKAVQLYMDKSYILWQITETDDLVALSSFPPNNPAAWCTKSPGTAASYLKTGPEYVAYKDGEPLFQIDPHDPSGRPQFMSRHNTKMHSSRMMNMEAAELLNRAMAGGAMNEQAKKDFDHVLSVYKAPNLNDADTFDYLTEYVLVNGSAARKDPRFLEIEQTYVKPRYLIMEPDELRQLHNRYNRAGEATKEYILENKFVAKLVDKVKALPDYKSFLALSPGGQNPNKLTAEEWGLCFRFDGLFKHVYELFDKEFGFKTKFDQFKQAVKDKNATEVLKLCADITVLLKQNFPSNSYGSDAIRGFTRKTITEWGGERTTDCTPWDSVSAMQKAVLNMAKPFVKAGAESVIEQARTSDMGSRETVTYLQDSFNPLMNDAPQELRNELRSLMQNAINTIGAEKLKNELAEFTKVKDVKEKLKEMFAEEMRSYRGGEVRYRESSLPHWAREAVSTKLTELEELREKAREERAERGEAAPGGGRGRFAPTIALDSWLRKKQNDPATEDLDDRVITFLLKSPSYTIDQKMDIFLKMNNRKAEIDQWVIEYARGIADWRLTMYARKFYQGGWPALEEAYPQILHYQDYVNWAYQNRRIPEKERQLLANVAPRNTLDPQMEYMENHMGGQRWPALEARVVEVFSTADWGASHWDNPSRLAHSIIEYAKKYIQGRWKAIEPKLSENQGIFLDYVFSVLPDAKERLMKILDDEDAAKATAEGKKSSSLTRALMAALEG